MRAAQVLANDTCSSSCSINRSERALAATLEVALQYTQVLCYSAYCLEVILSHASSYSFSYTALLSVLLSTCRLAIIMLILLPYVIF
jgi:hypothetical protein